MRPCNANPGGLDGHTHGVISLDTLTGNGQTDRGGLDGHSHVIQNWTAQPGRTGHTHLVTCAYDGGGGVEGGM